MKKIIALLIALMMLALPFASAETLLISSPVLSAAGQTIDLSGLEIAAGINSDENLAVVQIDFNGNGQKLYGITLNVTPDGRVLIAPDGISNVYYMDVPVDVGHDQDAPSLRRLPESNGCLIRHGAPLPAFFPSAAGPSPWPSSRPSLRASRSPASAALRSPRP